MQNNNNNRKNPLQDFLQKDLDEIIAQPNYQSLTQSGIRIAGRYWIYKSFNTEKGLFQCVEKKGKPYKVLGYYLGSYYIASQPNLTARKPNTLLFLVLKEDLCGSVKTRYIENAPPFIAKIQLVKPLLYAVKAGITPQNKLYPWLIQYFGKEPKKFNQFKMFEVGALLGSPTIDNIPEFPKILEFLKKLKEISFEHNDVKILSNEDLEKIYKEIFAEEIENYQEMLKKQELEIPDIENNNNIDPDADEISDLLDF